MVTASRARIKKKGISEGEANQIPEYDHDGAWLGV